MNAYEQYVHKFTNNCGESNFAVCHWDEFHGQWQAPLDAETRRLTGCHTEFARTLVGIGGYKTKRQALARAKKLYA